MNEALTLTRPDAVLAGESAGSGREVLLLHAGGESRAVWRPVMVDLSAEGFRAVAYDQRGHGESGGAASDGVLAYGDDAKAMIGEMRCPVVVGGSLGGFALMLALEEFEDEVAGLVLVDVTPAPDRERTRAYLAPRGGLGASPLVEDILARAEEMTRIVTLLRLPILLVCGGAASPLDEKVRSEFSAMSPQAKVEIIDHAGHLVARDAPRELSMSIGRFMASEDVRARQEKATQ